MNRKERVEDEEQDKIEEKYSENPDTPTKCSYASDLILYLPLRLNPNSFHR